jgi:hypothetical protein
MISVLASSAVDGGFEPRSGFQLSFLCDFLVQNVMKWSLTPIEIATDWCILSW